MFLIYGGPLPLSNFLVFLLALVNGMVPYLENKTLTTQTPPRVC